MGLIKKISSVLINVTIFFLIVTFSPGLPPKTTFPFEEFSVAKPRALVGSLGINKLLDNAERLFEGKLDSPENLQQRDGAIYATLRDNRVVKITGDEIQTLTSFGKSCYNSNPGENVPCGRPLGMAFDTIGHNLIVMHSLLGVFTVDLKTGEKTQLVFENDVIGDDNPRPCKLFNSVAVADNGDLYFSHSSSEHDISKVALSVFPNPSGRLIHYSRKTKKTKVLLDKLWFGNGVALSPDEDFVVVAESHSSRMMRVWLKGDKKGKSEIFFDGLPGAPDNLSYDANGMWLALASAADDKNPMIPHLIAGYPTLRKVVVRLMELSLMPFQFINSVYPNQVTNFICREFGSMDMITFLLPPRRTVLRIDWDGKVIRSFHGFDKSVGSTTHVMRLGDYLYLGSVTTNFIARVKIQSL